MSLYLWLNIGTLFIPFVATFNKRILFQKNWYSAGLSLSITALFFLAWDIIFTEWGVWGFNPDYLSGIYFLNLPVEEWLFFITVPYACLFTYHCIKVLIKKNNKGNGLYTFSYILAALLIIVGFSNYDKLYTSVTFLLTGIFLLLHLFIYKNTFLKNFYLSYTLIYLFPFMLINGTLTGAFTMEPVVWYNNTQNLGIRIYTIPVEDYIYGFLLYLMNVSIYEWFQLKKPLQDFKKAAH